MAMRSSRDTSDVPRDTSLLSVCPMTNVVKFFVHSDLGLRATVTGVWNPTFIRSEVPTPNPSVATRKEVVAAA